MKPITPHENGAPTPTSPTSSSSSSFAISARCYMQITALILYLFCLGLFLPASNVIPTTWPRQMPYEVATLTMNRVYAEQNSTFFSDPECNCRRDMNISVASSFEVRPWTSTKSGLKSVCGLSATARGPGQKVISYTLYGSVTNAYHRGISANLKGIRKFYPGYIMRIYHDYKRGLKGERTFRRKKESEGFKMLCDLACNSSEIDMCDVHNLDTLGDISASFGMVWRFAPMADPLVAEWHSRDLDSRITLREQLAVREWRLSGTTYHVMRDHPQHGTPILGGMFGMRRTDQANSRAMKKDLEKILDTSRGQWRKGIDQSMLAKFVWPRARLDMVCHDSYLCLKYPSKFNRPWPSRRISGPNFSRPVKGTNNFVGSNGGSLARVPEGFCPKACRPKNHPGWLLC